MVSEPRPPKIPLSVLVVIHTAALDVLLIQVQGSGRIRLQDERDAQGQPKVVRLAFGGHNDQPYVSVARWLVDDAHGLNRLLEPPLQQSVPHAGYIQAYPPGVRENGGHVIHVCRELPPGIEVVKGHASEQGVSIKPGDLQIVNDGSLEDLRNKAQAALVQLSPNWFNTPTQGPGL